MDNTIHTQRNFIIGCSLLFFTIAFFIFSFTFEAGLGAGGKRYFAVFNDVSGLIEGNMVRVQGHACGFVEKIEVLDDMARVTLVVNKDVSLHDGATAQLRNKTFIGGNFISVNVGDHLTPPIKEFTILGRAVDPVTLHEVSMFASSALPQDTRIGSELMAVVEQVKALAPALEKLPKLQQKLTALLDRVGTIKAKVGRVQRVLKRSDLGFGNYSKSFDTRVTSILEQLSVLKGALGTVSDQLDGRVETSAQELGHKLGALAKAIHIAAEAESRLIMNLDKLLQHLVLFDELFVRQILQQEGVKALSKDKAVIERLKVLEEMSDADAL